jgi:lipooligosaccharide transport system ATP-binding protein
LVLTTHYMDEAARLCGRLVAMDHGRILAEGTPDDIVRDTVGREVLEWPAADWRPEWEERLRAGGVLRRALPIGATMYLYAEEAEAAWRGVLELAASGRAGGSASMRPRMRAATLEDAFLVLSGHDIEGEEEAAS